MNNKFLKTRWLISIAGMLGAIILAFFLLREPLLSDDELAARVTTIYGGKIENIVTTGDESTILFSHKGALYEVDVNRHTGSFSNLEIILDASHNTNPASNASLLTPEQANAIATSKYFGDVESNQLIDNYYEIKIASLTQVYTIHVDAYSGEIISVTIDS